MLIVLLVSQIIARYILLPTLALKSDWVVKYRKCQGGATLYGSSKVITCSRAEGRGYGGTCFAEMRWFTDGVRSSIT